MAIEPWLTCLVNGVLYNAMFHSDEVLASAFEPYPGTGAQEPGAGRVHPFSTARLPVNPLARVTSVARVSLGARG